MADTTYTTQPISSHPTHPNPFQLSLTQLDPTQPKSNPQRNSTHRIVVHVTRAGGGWLQLPRLWRRAHVAVPSSGEHRGQRAGHASLRRCGGERRAKSAAPKAWSTRDSISHGGARSHIGPATPPRRGVCPMTQWAAATPRAVATARAPGGDPTCPGDGMAAASMRAPATTRAAATVWAAVAAATNRMQPPMGCGKHPWAAQSPMALQRPIRCGGATGCGNLWVAETPQAPSIPMGFAW